MITFRIRTALDDPRLSDQSFLGHGVNSFECTFIESHQGSVMEDETNVYAISMRNSGDP